MYEIKKDGQHLSYEDELRYVRTQANGVTVYCEADVAEAVEINNAYNEPLEGITVEQISGVDAMNALQILGYTEVNNG